MTLIAQALSAALLHFVWQGTLAAILLWIGLLLLRNRSANARYLVSCAALAVMAALPAFTAWMLYRHAASLPIVSSMPTGTTAGVYAERIAQRAAPLAWITLWRQWTLPVWSMGVLIFALRLVFSCRHVARLRRMGQPAEGQIAETVATLARRMRATRAIRVLISTVAESPSVVGWLRPVILLPAATLAGLEQEQLRAVLAHEIAHIRRHDYLVNLAQTLVETLWFYHPAVWWASARIRHERELCCDDAAVAACGDAVTYARALTSLERLRGATPQLAIGSTGGSLLFRIQRLAGVKPEMAPSRLPGLATLALGLACFAMTVHWAKAQQPMQLQPMEAEWGITVSSTGQVLHRGRVPYPEATYASGVQGTVTLEATLDSAGNVADVHVLSGPAELRKTALQAVLQWQFADGRAGETQRVSIAFQKDARAQTERKVRQELTHLTEQFLEDEVKAAKEKGDGQAEQEAKKKLVAARVEELEAEKRAPAEDTPQVHEQFMKRELEVLNRTLEEQRKTLAERHPEVEALEAQINALNEQMTQFKIAHEGELPERVELNERQRQLESEYAQLQRQLESAHRTYGELHPVVKDLEAQIAALKKQVNAASGSFAGSPLTRIEVHGVPDNEREALGAQITVKLGDVLSEASMGQAVEAIQKFDPRLRARFVRITDSGDILLVISGPEPLK